MTSNLNGLMTLEKRTKILAVAILILDARRRCLNGHCVPVKSVDLSQARRLIVDIKSIRKYIMERPAGDRDTLHSACFIMRNPNKVGKISNTSYSILFTKAITAQKVASIRIPSPTVNHQPVSPCSSSVTLYRAFRHSHQRRIWPSHKICTPLASLPVGEIVIQIGSRVAPVHPALMSDIENTNRL